MVQVFRMMAIFIQYPWLAAVLGMVLLGLGRWRSRRTAVVVGVIWVLYAVYEWGMKQRWWCTGECNIRVDLLLLYPLLLVLTVVAVVILVRSPRSRTLGAAADRPLGRLAAQLGRGLRLPVVIAAWIVALALMILGWRLGRTGAVSLLSSVAILLAGPVAALVLTALWRYRPNA